MNNNIRNRIQAVENRNRNNTVPDLVQIFQDESGSWIAQETYSKKNTGGSVIKNSGNIKRKRLTTPEEYTPPEGFNGAVIVEGERGVNE